MPAFRSANHRTQDKRPDLQEAERVHRRHDKDIRQLSLLQSKGVAVLQVRRVSGNVLRAQNQEPKGEVFRREVNLNQKQRTKDFVEIVPFCVALTRVQVEVKVHRGVDLVCFAETGKKKKKTEQCGTKFCASTVHVEKKKNKQTQTLMVESSLYTVTV